MVYKLLVILHLIGAAAWIGGHVTLLGVVLPAARRAASTRPVLDFEKAFGRIGLAALIVQVFTGLFLATRWIGEWSAIFSAPTPAGHLILAKIAMLAVLLALAAHAAHRVLPRLTPEKLSRFTAHAWIVTGLSVLILICGVGVRTGGLLQ